ncbi:uncharacterized protein LOC134686678 [Mytilus trossulus]|uniref:uncharacterized protein LOC134686678 n=1 Tax=Mytilus trossulus TaxID=6551 RepID=UPI003005159D
MAKSAKSVSIAKAQVPVSCHFCNGLGTKWKCEECDVFMCSSCKEKVHGKLKSSQNHEVVSISDISKDPLDSIEVASEVVSSVFNTYNITVPFVSCLSCSNDDIVYILDNSEPTKCNFIKVKLLKASVRVLETHDLPMYDFALNRNDEILFTNIHSEEESPVRIISSGEITTVLDPKPMRLTAIHINKDNELICGLREQGPTFPVHDFSVRQIVIFGSDYRRKITLENDTKGRKLFRSPARISTDSKNVMYVADIENEDWKGKLLAIDRSGRLLFSYRGPPSLEKIGPTSLDVTPTDYIILLDVFNNALHVLDSKGILLALQFLNQFDIEKSVAICIDKEGFLLIGSSSDDDDDDDDENGKLYVVKLADQFMRY